MAHLMCICADICMFVHVHSPLCVQTLCAKLFQPIAHQRQKSTHVHTHDTPQPYMSSLKPALPFNAKHTLHSFARSPTRSHMYACMRHIHACVTSTRKCDAPQSYGSPLEIMQQRGISAFSKHILACTRCGHVTDSAYEL